MKRLKANQLLRRIRHRDDFERFIGKFTNYERMRSFRYTEDTLSLERMDGLAHELGDPQTHFPSVHIAGTKGKGTTSLILESLLAASGNTVGTYTSPHIEQLCERIRISGDSIGMPELCATTNSILPVLEERWERGQAHFPTFFELMTALAMLVFKNRRVSWGIFEVGLGGRLDATNILKPNWTLITSIGLEHTEKLGKTVELIAREKSGIVKESTPLVLGDVPPEAESVIQGVARQFNAPILKANPGLVQLAGRDFLSVEGPSFSGTVFSGAIRGPALRADLSLALTVWQEILRGEGRTPGFQEMKIALSRLKLPARVEVLDCHPPVVIDGAHTLESIRALCQSLKEIRFPRPRGLVFALAADKSMEPILQEIEGLAEETFFTRIDPVRGRDPGELTDVYRKLTGLPAKPVEHPGEAFQQARATGYATVVTGSFYLAGHLRPLARQL